MPTKGPATLRSPRTRAIEIGTTPAGFVESPGYCAQCGHPIMAGLPHSHYEGKDPNVQSGGAHPIQGNPIKSGGNPY